jgi:serine protease Do
MAKHVDGNNETVERLADNGSGLHGASVVASADGETRRKSGRRMPGRRLCMVAKVLGIVVLCAVSSALTAWALLAAGVIKADASQTIAQNRQSIVLQQGEIVAEVFKKVSPSTVSITTQAQVGSGSHYLYGATSMEEGAGSGVIISANGYVLTNKHVVPTGTSKLSVILADGTTYSDVSVVGRDPLNDIAFLKINGAKNLPAAELGDSDGVQPGQQVVAIGNALGEFQNSVTSGIISGKGRPIEASDESGSSEQLENLLQTDAAINFGNSGGPLVTLEGKVIGVNTAISQDGQAIGFAIPINDIKSQAASVLKSGKIVRPYLGVRYISLDKATAQQLNLTVTQGAYIPSSRSVMSGSPAQKAGLQVGDVITKVNGVEITQSHSLASCLSKYAPDDKLTLSIVRDGKAQDVSVTLEAYPE